MQTKTTSQFSNRLYRILDANINRLKEGMRVCEEFTRFILEDYTLTQQLKSIRHKLDGLIKELGINKVRLLKERDSLHDIGKDILGRELKRRDIKDVFFSNLQRIKESLRVIEEFSKVINKRLAVRFKDIRYLIYDIEKKAAFKIQALRRSR